MRQASKRVPDSAEKTVRDIRRARTNESRFEFLNQSVSKITK
jgi:hypothetical protein